MVMLLIDISKTEIYSCSIVSSKDSWSPGKTMVIHKSTVIHIFNLLYTIVVISVLIRYLENEEEFILVSIVPPTVS